MPNGIYLSIGLNTVDVDVYGTDILPLRGCVNDANDIARIATKAGFTGHTLLNEEATSSAVLTALHAAAKQLQPGDMLIVAYSGHGGQVGDVNGDENDGLDETWCLHDRMLIDDELYSMWAQFKPGVRVFVLSDSCHSGTVLKGTRIRNLLSEGFVVATEDAPRDKGATMASAPNEGSDDADALTVQAVGRAKTIGFFNSWQVYAKNRPMYDALQFVAGPSDKAVIGASVILISGCQDNQLSQDGNNNGMFTYALKQVWANGTYAKGYAQFHKDIRAQLPSTQSPNYMTVGAVNLGFEAQRPFTL